MGYPVKVRLPHEYIKVVGMEGTSNVALKFALSYAVNLPVDKYDRTEVLGIRMQYLTVIDRAKYLVETQEFGKPVSEYHLDMGFEIAKMFNLDTGDVDVDMESECKVTADAVDGVDFSEIIRRLTIDKAVYRSLPVLKKEGVARELVNGYLLLCYLKRDPDAKLLKLYVTAVHFFEKLYAYYQYKKVVQTTPRDDNLNRIADKLRGLLPKEEKKEEPVVEGVKDEDLWIEL